MNDIIRKIEKIIIMDSIIYGILRKKSIYGFIVNIWLFWAIWKCYFFVNKIFQKIIDIRQIRRYY
jgi:hypothetical protein